jgi:hypothetical protein
MYCHGHEQVTVPNSSLLGPQGSRDPREYPSALLNWADTNASALSLEVWVNGSYSAPGQPPNAMRWSKSMNLAANAYLRHLLVMLLPACYCT